MKKIISALLLVVVVSTSCFSQNNTPSYNNGRDFFSIKKYLQDNLDSLDPIEGIYNVQIDRTYERIETAMNGNKFYNNYSDNYTNRFAIVRFLLLVLERQWRIVSKWIINTILVMRIQKRKL